MRISYAQQIYINPLLGIKADIGNSTAPNGIYGDVVMFDYKYYPLSFNKRLSPLLLGVLIEVKQNKNSFSTGIIYGDNANSELSIGFKTRENLMGKTYTGYVKNRQNAGVNVLKIPLFYKHTLYRFNNKEDKENLNKSCINFTTGFNIMYIRPNTPINPISSQSISENGDTIELMAVEINLNKKWSASFNLGFDVDVYIKNKRRVTLSLYYEQGTRKLSLSQYDVWINNKYNTSFSSFSRGSAIQLKLLFPIKIYDKAEHIK